LGLWKLELFDPVAQDKTGFHLQQTLQNQTTQTVEKIEAENPLIKHEVTTAVKIGRRPQKLAKDTRSEPGSHAKESKFEEKWWSADWIPAAQHRWNEARSYGTLYQEKEATGRRSGAGC
jgi:hypothetical protein